MSYIEHDRNAMIGAALVWRGRQAAINTAGLRDDDLASARRFRQVLPQSCDDPLKGRAPHREPTTNRFQCVLT